MRKEGNPIFLKNAINALSEDQAKQREYRRERSRDAEEAIQERQAQSLNQVLPSITSRYVCWLSDDNEVIPFALDQAVEMVLFALYK